MVKDLSGKLNPAHVYLRGHYHVYIREFLEMPWQGTLLESWLVVCPSWAGPTTYARKVTKSTPFVDNGLILLESQGDSVRVHRMVEPFDLRTTEAIG